MSQFDFLLDFLQKTTIFVKASTCYRLTAVVVILVNYEFSPLNVFFQSYYRGMNGCYANIVKSLKQQQMPPNFPTFKELKVS